MKKAVIDQVEILINNIIGDYNFKIRNNAREIVRLGNMNASLKRLRARIISLRKDFKVVP